MNIKRKCLAVALACALLAGCGGPKNTPSASGSASGGGTQSSAAVSGTEEPVGSGAASVPAGSSSAGQKSDVSQQQPPDQSGQGPDMSAQGPDTSGQAEPNIRGGDGTGEPFDFAQDAPETPRVDDAYFADAAFVGDSRTDGLLIYGGMKGAANLTSNGLSIFQLEEKKALTIGGKKYTLLEALALKKYGKVYLSLGVNELGYYDDEGFYESYCKAVDDIRACQPDAVIYIQGLIPLNEGVIRQSGGRDYLKNDHLRIYNDLMRKTAREKNVVFLDLYSAFVDRDGELPAEASKDGVHLRKDYCRQWMDYLRTHTVSHDAYFAGKGTEQKESEETTA